MSSYEYNELLKFLYFEGYSDSYEEAEYILESMTDEEFEEVLEAYKEPNFEKMKRQEYRHTKQATSQSRGSRGSAKNRSFKMATIRGSLERGEDPRRDTFGGVRASNPEDHRAAYSKNPLNNPPRRVKEPGVKKEEYMNERWDEPGERDSAQVRVDNAYFAKRLKNKKEAEQRMKEKGSVPKKNGKDMFEENNKKMKGEDPCWKGYEMVGTKKKGGKEVPNCVPKENFEAVVEYLFVEGYADSIESAEIMAQNISETWVNEILNYQ